MFCWKKNRVLLLRYEKHRYAVIKYGKRRDKKTETDYNFSNRGG